MAHQVLLMISNSNLGLRELYTAVLSNEFPGWRVSFMTGLPERAVEIMAGYDLVIYELGKPDDPRRIETVRLLGDQLHESTATRLFTHLEGFLAADTVSDLAAHHVHALTGTLTWQDLATALRVYKVVPDKPKATNRGGNTGGTPDAGSSGGLLGRMQGFFRRDTHRSTPTQAENAPDRKDQR